MVDLPERKSPESQEKEAEGAYGYMQNTDKGNYWAFIIWQDNVITHPDWKERLMATYLRFCVSPYHDKDIWSEDDCIRHPERAEYIMDHLGEPKKPHYHVLIHCDQNTTWKTMKK